MENNTNNETQTESFSETEQKAKDDHISIKININTRVAIIMGAIIVGVGILGVTAYYLKGLVVAATVDGSPISRLAVIRELEKASGKSSLDSLIAKKLIQNEASKKKVVINEDEINAEIKKIEGQITSQGGTLEEALASRSMSMNDLKGQIVFQKQIEKLVADKIAVTDEEVAQYIQGNEIPIEKGQEATTASQIKDGLKNQKLNTEADGLITSLKAQAKIRYFVEY